MVHLEVERNPPVLARKIREDNLGLLSNVSVRTLSRHIHDAAWERSATMFMMTTVNSLI